MYKDKTWEEQANKQVVEWRRAFHQAPELSAHEEQTAIKIMEVLQQIGLEPQKAANCNGVTALIKGALPGATIALRADMDALPIQESLDLPYKSQNEGVMHACGHDMHMAILLGTALRLQNSRDLMKGNVRLIFQPAEELAPTGGARLMMEAGFLEGVQAIFGLHVWPDLPCGKLAVKARGMMAASDRFKLTLIGKTSHAAHPHQGIDAIMAAADVLQNFSHIISRKINPVATATISVGTIHGGDRYNVVAGRVVLEGTVRTLDKDSREKIPLFMEDVLEGLKRTYGLEYQLDYKRGYPVLDNWEVPTELVQSTASALLGKEAVLTNPIPELTAEDFSFYLSKYPGTFLWLGCHKKGEDVHGLHNAGFCPDEEALTIGSSLMSQVALDALDALFKGVDFTKRE